MSTTERHPEIPFLVSRYPSLESDLVGQSAVQGQLVTYPKIARALDDPTIPGQQFVNLSYMLLADPVTLESGKKMFGYVKFRGAYPSQETAQKEGERIIREVDSKWQVRVALGGQWIPITEDDTRIKDKIDVVTNDEGDKPALRDAALQRKRNEDQRIQRELREHEDELRRDTEDETPLEEKERTLDGYVTKRNTEMKLLEMEEKYLYQLKAMRYNMARLSHEMGCLERDHPEYNDQWLDRMNEERTKYGHPNYVPSEKELTHHETGINSSNLDQPYPVNNELRHAKISMI